MGGGSIADHLPRSSSCPRATASGAKTTLTPSGSCASEAANVRSFAWRARAHQSIATRYRRTQRVGRGKLACSDLLLHLEHVVELLRQAHDGAQSEALTSPRARRVVHGDVPDRLPPGVRAGTVWPGELVSAQQGIRPDGAAHADPGAGACETAVWIWADLGAAATRGLDREPKASAATVPAAGASATHARTPAEALCASPRTGTDSHRACRTLEHGFRSRCFR